jgi:hypothetical protein
MDESTLRACKGWVGWVGGWAHMAVAGRREGLAEDQRPEVRLRILFTAVCKMCVKCVSIMYTAGFETHLISFIYISLVFE